MRRIFIGVDYSLAPLTLIDSSPAGECWPQREYQELPPRPDLELLVHDGTTLGWGGLAFDLCFKGQVIDRTIISTGRTVASRVVPSQQGSYRRAEDVILA